MAEHENSVTPMPETSEPTPRTRALRARSIDAAQDAAVPEALDAVPEHVRDAATAVGYTRITQLLKVELPLAIPVLVASLRVVAVTNISMVSVGSVIGIGGLGTWFTEGYQADKSDQIIAGIIAIFVLAVVIDALIMLAGRAITPWVRATRVRSGAAT